MTLWAVSRKPNLLPGRGGQEGAELPHEGVWGLFSDMVAGINAVSSDVIGPVLPNRQGITIEVFKVILKGLQDE